MCAHLCNVNEVTIRGLWKWPKCDVKQAITRDQRSGILNRKENALNTVILNRSLEAVFSCQMSLKNCISFGLFLLCSVIG